VLSVVIPAGGGAARLKCALQCLAASLHGGISNIEVIVVNDGGALEIRDCVHRSGREYAVDFELVEIPRGGRSAARNAGAARSRGDRLLFIDSDVLLEKEALVFHSTLNGAAARIIYRGTILHLPWLTAFADPVSGELTVEASRSLRLSNEDACLLASRKLSREAIENPELLKAGSRRPPFQRDLQRWFGGDPANIAATWIGCTGGQFSVDRSVWETLGGFDERMGLRWGAEDLEFGYRAVESGIAVRHAERARCYHMDHPVHGRDRDHEWALEYFAHKHANPGILRLSEYFGGKCSLNQVLEACHGSA